MKIIDAETINERSSYKVTQVDEYSVRFITSDGVRYLVGFHNDIFIFDNNAYWLYVINENEPQKRDPKVGQTIITIIQDLFRHTSDSVSLYVCSPSEGQQETRHRLFKGWFANACFTEQFTLETHHQVDNGKDFYYGLILRKDNIDHDWIIKTFHEFFED